MGIGGGGVGGGRGGCTLSSICSSCLRLEEAKARLRGCEGLNDIT
jgi:hypothetical protein